MEPLSRRKRNIYFVIFSIIFIIGVPLFIFDAKGYKINFLDVVKFSKTGGLYVTTSQSGTDIYLNNKLVKTSGAIQKNMFIQDLKPGIYNVRASKEGLQSWQKILTVYPELVTEARTFLVKDKPELEEVYQYINDDGTPSTSTPRLPSNVKNPEYEKINSLFLATTSPKSVGIKATSSEETISYKNIVVENRKGSIFVSIQNYDDTLPNYFCHEDFCKREIAVTTPSKVRRFDFMPGRDDVLIVRLMDGIYAIEIDDRSTQNIQKIIDGADYDFRIGEGGVFYIKKGTEIYSISI